MVVEAGALTVDEAPLRLADAPTAVRSAVAPVSLPAPDPRVEAQVCSVWFDQQGGAWSCTPRTCAGVTSSVSTEVGVIGGGTVGSEDEGLRGVRLSGLLALLCLGAFADPTVGDLDKVLRRFRESGAAARVDLSIAPAAGGLPPQVQAAVHRVVQESLTNVSRYARGAQRVCVDLACAGGLTVLTVVDSGGRVEEAPGAGDDAVWGGGFGIVGMRERVVALGGTLTAGPSAGLDGSTAEGGGWTVRAEVPA